MNTTLSLLGIVLVSSNLFGQSAPVGVYRLTPTQLHPQVLSQLPGPGLNADGEKIPLHESVPLKLTMSAGKRPSEIEVKSVPDLNIRKFIVPGLLNVSLKYGKSTRRDHRWEVTGEAGALNFKSHSGTGITLQKREIVFLDLDGDGAFGSLRDGWILKEPTQKQWAKPGENIVFNSMRAPCSSFGQKVWFYVASSGFAVTVTASEPDLKKDLARDYVEALIYMNALRDKVGSPPVVFDPALSIGCELHSLYLSKNGGELSHDEDPKLPGYSPEGAKAGKGGNLTKTDSMRNAIDDWMDSFYHRINVLLPQADLIGMGNVDGIQTLDVWSGAKAPSDHAPYAWPPHGAVDVPVTWNKGEVPSPLGAESFSGEVARRWGYPITLTFPDKNVKDAKAQLFSGDAEVPCFVSSPEFPSNTIDPNTRENFNSIFFMSRAPLEKNTLYRCVVSAVFRGKPFTKEWTFMTK